MDLKKYKNQSKKSGMSEVLIHSLRVINSKIKNLKSTCIDRLTRKTLHWIFTSGTYDTVGGGTTEDIALLGVLPEMIATVTVNTYGGTPITRLAAKCGTDKITLVFDVDPAADHVLNYTVTYKST